MAIDRHTILTALEKAILRMEAHEQRHTCSAISTNVNDPVRVWYSKLLVRHTRTQYNSVSAFHLPADISDNYTTRHQHRLMWLAFLYSYIKYR